MSAMMQMLAALYTAVAPSTSYGAPATLGQGDRTALITVTTTITISSGTINNLVDGVTGTGATDAVDFGTSAFTTADYIQYDLGSAKYFDEFTFFCQTANTNGNWKYTASNTAGSGYVDVSAAFSWVNATQITAGTLGPSDAYRYIRLVPTGSGNLTGNWYEEQKFKIAA